MNLTRQGALSQISEDGIPDLTNNVHGIGHGEENITANNVARSFSTGFSIGSWEDSNSIVFSNPASKGVHNNDDIIASLSNYELQFGALKETTGIDKYLQMQHDQVPFRVRAKRGCATHPRSIAERRLFRYTNPRRHAIDDVAGAKNPDKRETQKITGPSA
ncbi:hypothetical protein PVAP13_7KG173000 [Panicum virgatum]|uniref:Uncharacterized protein n=1 Tax=Panicum virgatum TaxID=38727 RepID=A0A8T0QEG2_PANVG|nr:hypothetical protein PVAP13_7KG173000 [Panicum virgatum]